MEAPIFKTPIRLNYIPLTLLVAVILWGSNNAITKYLVASWPPLFIGVTRFLIAGVILLGLARYVPWLGSSNALSPSLRRRLWTRGAFNLALYIIAFNVAMAYTTASHVALYLGTAPVWALLWEGRPRWNFKSLKSYGAAILALSGVVFLFWPALKLGGSAWVGEVLGLASSILWTIYGRDCRAFRTELSPAEISGHTFIRGSVILIPLAAWELYHYLNSHTSAPFFQPRLLLLQSYCIIASGVIAFILWSNALRHWPVSKVYLFNNLIPISTMLWAFLLIQEPITSTFWPAMGLICGGVLFGQTQWEIFFKRRFLSSSSNSP
ncbi:MAG: DMT family transporter [Verrucomicrobia bacterium]|nr:MAG: DMT family transporter [Verrucomicrobiota bacterium]